MPRPNDLWREFEVTIEGESVCGLCGDSGMAELLVIGSAYCLCPRGRALKLNKTKEGIMRRRARVDANHAEIVKALRAIGASVQDLSRVGAGCPDLAVGYHGVTVLLECKAGKNGLTGDQFEWFTKWAGAAVVVHTPEEAQTVVIERCVPRRIA